MISEEILKELDRVEVELRSEYEKRREEYFRVEYEYNKYNFDQAKSKQPFNDHADRTFEFQDRLCEAGRLRDEVYDKLRMIEEIRKSGKITLEQARALGIKGPVSFSLQEIKDREVPKEQE